MVKSLPGLGLIAAIVAVAFLINDLQPAVSPLALCVGFGFAVANFGRWPSFAAAGTGLASKKLMRIGVALLGAQVSIISLKAIGLKGVLTVLLVVTLTIFGILALSKVFKITVEGIQSQCYFQKDEFFIHLDPSKTDTPEKRLEGILNF